MHRSLEPKKAGMRLKPGKDVFLHVQVLREGPLALLQLAVHVGEPFPPPILRIVAGVEHRDEMVVVQRRWWSYSETRKSTEIHYSSRAVAVEVCNIGAHRQSFVSAKELITCGCDGVNEVGGRLLTPLDAFTFFRGC